ncbi:amidase family protein [Streptomyces platensis]|uniref:amidase family protein n=1 Tax=Streptomyces platensis TaxID=58346 RepID=UPI003C2F5023
MCLPWSNAGLPSVSLPAGRAANGLPLGLQLIGGSGTDEELLQGAAGIERLLNGEAREEDVAHRGAGSGDAAGGGARGGGSARNDGGARREDGRRSEDARPGPVRAG